MQKQTFCSVYFQDVTIHLNLFLIILFYNLKTTLQKTFSRKQKSFIFLLGGPENQISDVSEAVIFVKCVLLELCCSQPVRGYKKYYRNSIRNHWVYVRFGLGSPYLVMSQEQELQNRVV